MKQHFAWPWLPLTPKGELVFRFKMNSNDEQFEFPLKYDGVLKPPLGQCH